MFDFVLNDTYCLAKISFFCITTKLFNTFLRIICHLTEKVQARHTFYIIIYIPLYIIKGGFQTQQRREPDTTFRDGFNNVSREA
jgi:phage-related holin